MVLCVVEVISFGFTPISWEALQYVGINIASTLVVRFTAISFTFASIAACGEGVGAGVPGVATVGLVALAGLVGSASASAGVGTCGLTALPADVFMATK